MTTLLMPIQKLCELPGSILIFFVKSFMRGIMRLRITLPVAVALVVLLLLRSNTISFAQVSAPTPAARPYVAAPQTIYKTYLPIIFANLPVAAKKGVPLTYPNTDCAVVTTMNAWWEYSWSPTPPNCPGVENVPMISVPAEVNSTLTGNSQWIMGFNEPDEPWQPAYMDPATGAQLWRQIEQKYPNKKLLSPGTGSEDYTHWLTNFRNSYISQYGTPPRLDGLAAHCLKWVTSQCIDFTNEYITWANAWGASEVWVAEISFASDPNCPAGASPTQAAQMEQDYLNWLKDQPKVTRYAWFASRLPPGTQNPACFYTPLVDWNTNQPTIYGNVYLPYR